MSEQNNVPDSTLAVTLTVKQLRELIREEIQAASKQNLDKLLDAEEAAMILHVSKDWLYRHACHLPFTRKLGPKVLRFSFGGIQKYLASRKSA